jgi:V8-like Glu-specific endopeptidase
MSLWDEARSLIVEGEAETVLDMMENFLKGRLGGALNHRVRPLLDTVVLLRAQGRRLQTNLLDRTLTAEEFRVEQTKRDQSILRLTNEVERVDNLPPPSSHINDLPDQVVSEKLMGSESQLRSTGWLAEGLRLASAVCRLTDDLVLGSGFRCRPDAVITNNHVIGGKDAATKFRAEFFFEEDAARKLRAPMPIALDPERLFWTSEALDATIIGLGTVPSQDVAVIPLSSDVTARVNDRVSIVQHPSGGPKQIAVTNNRILNVLNPYVHYMTDTLPGSSGSPVFLDSWRVVAIHHAGGNMRKNVRGDVIFANEGVLITALLEDPGFRSVYLGTT